MPDETLVIKDANGYQPGTQFRLMVTRPAVSGGTDWFEVGRAWVSREGRAVLATLDVIIPAGETKLVEEPGGAGVSGRRADVFVTALASDGGYVPVGLGWASPEGGWRLRCFARPGAARFGLFLPAGCSGVLPSRVTVHASSGDQVGSGAFVRGLRGVMLQVSAWPAGRSGECWLTARVPEGARLEPVTARR
ncbi:hypothetical protein AMD26_020275 [Deinococcus sp. UR1]|nr:hypothetical protein AMD26_020275 [Deinococcus sp. UR1]